MWHLIFLLFFLTAVQHMSSTQLREADSGALQHVKLGFLGQKFTLQINTVSQF